MNLSGARRSCGAGLIAAAVAALVFFSGLAPADAGTIIMFTDENAYHAGETIPAEFPHDSSGIVQERTSDVGRGQHLRIRDGDWTEYNFSNPRTATFVVQARVASGSNGGTISFNRNGSALGSIEVASTGGWDNWTTVSTTIEFEYGLAPLRLTYTGEGDDELFHLNWISITWLDATPDFFEGTEVFAIPGQIEAEDWIDISRSFNAPTDDTGGGEHVTGILGGDWTEYHVDVEQAGRYEVEARVATIPALTGFYRGGFINIITDDRRLGLLEVGDTGGDGSWATVSTTVELEAGRQVLQLAFTGDLTGGNMMRINWVRFERKPGPPKPPLDDEDRRQLAMAELIGALESYGDANGTYLVDGGGFKGRGSGWLFYGLEGTTYPVSVASILTAEGHLSADVVHDPLWVSETSTVGDVLVYRCKDRVAVFSRHSDAKPSSYHADWWSDNGCTQYPINNLNATYYQVSKSLPADLDGELERQLAMAELIGALESYGEANGTYLVDGGGFKGRGSGWLFYGLEGTTYPVSVASILTAEGHLSADAVRDPLWVSETSTVGDVLVYRCKDRVAVFTRHSGIRPSSEDADWWRDNGCTQYPINNLNASYYQISKHLGD